MTVTILVLTLNEIIGIKEVMPKIKKEWYDQLIIVDGNSTDGTVEWAINNGYEVYIQKQKGFRHAYFEVWPMLTGDIILTFSPDGNTLAEDIPKLINKLKNENLDLVIGSRYLDDAKSEDDDIITSFGNWLFTKTVNILHGGNFTDVMVINRAFKKNLPEKLNLFDEKAYSLPEKLFFTKISWEPLMSVRAAKAKLKISEVPSDEPPRIGGERKLQVLRWGAAYYFQFIRELWFWRESNRSS